MRTITTAAATVGLLVLAGCGGSDTSSDNSSPSTTSTTGASPSTSATGGSPSSAATDTSTPPADTSDDEPAFDSASGAIEVPFGMVYGYGVKADSTVQDLSVSSMQCGATVLKKAQSDPNGSGDRIDYPAKSGKQFCIVKGISKNTGNLPINMLPYLRQVRGNDGKTYQQSEADSSAASEIRPDGWEVPGYAIDPLNPGDEMHWINVYQVPAGVTPKAVVIQAYMSDAPEAMLLLPAPATASGASVG